MKHITVVCALLFSLLAASPLAAGTDRESIHEKAEQVNPLLPGMEAPAFEVLDPRGQRVQFNPENLSRPLILTFFRGGWCPYCNLHLSELRMAEKELVEMGFDLWFVSVDRPELLYDSLEQPDIDYRIFSDASLQATRAFGIAFQMPDDRVEEYLGFGIDLEAASGETHHVLPAASTFLIGQDGTIRFQYTNPDYTVRLHPDVLLAAAGVYLAGVNDRLRLQNRARKEKRP